MIGLKRDSEHAQLSDEEQDEASTSAGGNKKGGGWNTAGRGKAKGGGKSKKPKQTPVERVRGFLHFSRD